MDDTAGTPESAARSPQRMGKYLRVLGETEDAVPVGAASGSSFRVLVVDDDPATRRLYSIHLALRGFEVLEASDGRHGLERARAEAPDLVVTDVMMPGLDGFELAAALRADERTSRIPLIFLSGETAAVNETRAGELGALAYLRKPLDFGAFATLVAHMLEGLGPPVPDFAA
ncbi:MAG TPA: response regulator [Gaiellaceae bacterium]|nr:response regulator [Gaiellaceae bacterium]